MRWLLLLALAADPGPTIRLKDEGGAAKAVRELNCVGSGITCSSSSTFGTITVGGSGSTPSTTCPAGQFMFATDGGIAFCAAPLGTPGPPPFSVQYNCPDGGGFCGALYVFSDGGFLGFVPVTTHPAAPIAEGQLHYSFQFAAGAPIFPMVTNSTTKTPMPEGLPALFNFYAGAAPTWQHYVCAHEGYGSSAKDCTSEGQPPGGGSMTALTATGGNAVVIGAGWMNLQKRLLYSTAGAANSSSGLHFNKLHLCRGDGPNVCGFVWQTRVGHVVTHSSERIFIGLYGVTSAPIAVSDPSHYGADGGVIGDVFFVGADAADTNLSCCTHGAADAGLYTCTTLGSDFPKAAFDAGYDITLSAAPGNADGGTTGQVECTVCARKAGTCTTLVLTSDLPTNTALMNWMTVHNSGTGGSSLSANYTQTNVTYNPGP